MSDDMYGIAEGIPGLRPGQFDIFNQTFELIGPDGSTQMLSTLDIEFVRLMATRTGICLLDWLKLLIIVYSIFNYYIRHNGERHLSWGYSPYFARK
jgi:hypothetical protein